jgi:non-specific serine/threonine protein kinase
VSDSGRRGNRSHRVNRSNLRDNNATRPDLPTPIRLPRAVPDPTTVARPSNLPAEISSFVGRERQIAEVGQYLATQRLVTLIGTGGVGKTRLALEVARRVAERSGTGVQFVPLASLVDPSLVETEVVHALGLRESPGQSLRRSLELALRERDLLLVLDNFEHLLPAAPLVVAWLEACPRLTVLATSRAPLGLAGEQRYTVPPLTLPESGASLDAAEAVGLFVERARSVRPDFHLAEAHASAVTEICRRLDGLPLAIELAAARARMLSPADIATRLDDRFRLLVGGSRAAPRRQRTLQATIDWSHALLSDPERVLLRRLSVFAGGWTLDAAEAVGGTDDLPDVFDGLAQLIDQSLVIVEEADGSTRYRLLEMLRQYGEERLAEAGETAILRRRHAEWTRTLAERASIEMWGPDQAAWLDRLDVEHDNLRAALTWCEQAGEVELGLRLGWRLWRFWDQRGHYSEARTRLTRLLAANTTPSTARALALDAAGMLAFFQQDLAEARQRLEEGLALGRALEHPSSIAMALVFLGAVFTSQGDLDQARARFEACEPLRSTIAEQPTDFVVDTTWLLFAAIVARLRSDDGQASELLEEGLARARARGDRSLSCYFLVTLASIALGQGDHARATTLQRESLSLARAVGNKMPIAAGFDGLACIAAAEGRGQRAARLFGAAEAVWASLAATLLPWFSADHDHGLAVARLQSGEAAFATAWAAGRALPLPQAIEYALETTPEDSMSSGAGQDSAPDVRSVDALTPREQEIVALIGRGYTNRQIAAALVISERTSEWHTSNVLAKVGLDSRAQLAVWAARHGLSQA